MPQLSQGESYSAQNSIVSPIINKGKLKTFSHMENFKNISHSHSFLGNFWRCAHQNKKINQRGKTWDPGKMSFILGEW